MASAGDIGATCVDLNALAFIKGGETSLRALHAFLANSPSNVEDPEIPCRHDGFPRKSGQMERAAALIAQNPPAQ